MKTKVLFFLLSISLFQIQCKTDDENPVAGCQSDFDQEALFNNLAYNLIIPGYESLAGKTNQLLSLTESFLENPDESKLTDLQSGLEEAWLIWQAVAAFEFGPAENVFLRNSLNNFPVDASAVDEIINTGIYDLDQPDRFDKGFPAMEYLLFGYAESPDQLITSFQSKPGLGAYLRAMVQDVQERVSSTYDAWLNGYAQTFIENTGTSAGSSLSLYINNLNQFYEIIKRDQIGIPSGVLTLGFPNPDKVEAYYSSNSLALARAALEANIRFYKGDAISGQAGVGLDDYLNTINALKEGQPLDEVIQDQYQTALSQFNEIEGPLQTAVETEQEAVSAAYTELTRQLVHLKTDLPSVLCVSITYIDNPSDSD